MVNPDSFSLHLGPTTKEPQEDLRGNLAIKGAVLRIIHKSDLNTHSSHLCNQCRYAKTVAFCTFLLDLRGNWSAASTQDRKQDWITDCSLLYKMTPGVSRAIGNTSGNIGEE